MTPLRPGLLTDRVAVVSGESEEGAEACGSMVDLLGEKRCKEEKGEGEREGIEGDDRAGRATVGKLWV